MLPDDRKYSKDHLWVKSKGEKLIVGLTEHFFENIDFIIHLSLPKMGEDVEQNEVFGGIETSEQVIELISPVSGEVVRTNGLLKNDHSVIIEDPYGSGWLMEIEPSDENELEELISPDGYEEGIK